ncbi:hypothetical protein ACWKV8_10790 [Brevundimonas diminuta ATCC 11568]|jgi:hypothetical protein
MTGACVTAAILALGLGALPLRRIVSPARFAQTLGGVALGLLLAASVAPAGGGHG